MAVPPLDDTKTYPHMAHWFDPVLLLKLLNNVVVSWIFGQYADRRLIIAALDTVPPEEQAKRAKDFPVPLDAGQGRRGVDRLGGRSRRRLRQHLRHGEFAGTEGVEGWWRSAAAG